MKIILLNEFIRLFKTMCCFPLPWIPKTMCCFSFYVKKSSFTYPPFTFICNLNSLAIVNSHVLFFLPMDSQNHVLFFSFFVKSSIFTYSPLTLSVTSILHCEKSFHNISSKLVKNPSFNYR